MEFALLMLHLCQTLQEERKLPSSRHKQKPSPSSMMVPGPSAGRCYLPGCVAEPWGCPQLPQCPSAGRTLAGSAWASVSPKPKKPPCYSPARRPTWPHRQASHTREPGPRLGRPPRAPCAPAAWGRLGGRLGGRLRPALGSRPPVVQVC